MLKRKIRSLVITLSILVSTFGGVSIPYTTHAAAVTAICADSIVDSIGVNTHTYWTNNVYQNFSSYEQKLIDLGVRYVREQLVLNSPTQRNCLSDLYNKAGIKTLFILDSRNGGGTAQQLLDYTKTYAIQNYTAAFEGPNEYDCSGDSNWATNLRNYQIDLWNKFKADPATSSKPLIGPSIVCIPEIQGVNNYAALGNIATYCDGGNIHPYPGGNDVPTNWSGTYKNYSQTYNVGNKPIWASEAGYHNDTYLTSGHLGVTELAESKYIDRMILDFYQQGLAKTFKYELISQGTDQTNLEHWYGLLHSDYSIKPAYTALKNLITLLKDSGSNFTPGTLNYSISGNTANLKSMLLQKRDGTFYLALWSDERVYDAVAKQDLNPEDKAITLTFNQRVSQVVTYLPRTSTNAVNTYNNPTSVSLSVPEEVMLVRITTSTQSGNLISNSGFETGTLANWIVSGDTTAGYAEGNGGHTGTYKATCWKATSFDTSINQTITGLVNGTYTLKAWVQSSGGQNYARIEAKNFGGSTLYSDIPAGGWTQLTISNINVTNGQITVDMWVNDSGNHWCNMDDVTLTKN